MIYIFIFILGALSNAIRGGQHGKVRRLVEGAVGIRHDKTGAIIGRLKWYQLAVNRIMDGDVINAFAFGLAISLIPSLHFDGFINGIANYSFVDPDYKMGLFAAMAMWAGAAPGWGDYIGAMGGWRERNLKEWPPIDKHIEHLKLNPVAWGFMGMTYRGLLWGFLIALSTNSLYPIIGGLLMGAFYYVCLLAFNSKGWPVAEWVFGGFFWFLCIFSLI